MSGHTPVPGFAGYFVTRDGRVWSTTGWRGHGLREVAPVTNGKGYLKVRLTVDGRRCNVPVHRIVAEAFLGPRPSSSHEVRHLDGDRSHNSIANLAWGTRKENAADREQHGRTSRGERHSAAIRAGLEARHVG